VKGTAVAQGNSVERESNQDLKAQSAAYVTGQPEPAQRIHRWMNWLTAASLAVPVGLFIRALYLSINSKGTSPAQITAGWFIFVASGTLPILLFGLHSATLRAFPAMPISGLAPQLVTGSKAVASGVGLMVMAVAAASFWGLFAHSVVTPDWALLEKLVRILTAVVSAVAVVAVIQHLLRQLSRSL